MVLSLLILSHRELLVTFVDEYYPLPEKPLSGEDGVNELQRSAQLQLVFHSKEELGKLSNIIKKKVKIFMDGTMLIAKISEAGSVGVSEEEEGTPDHRITLGC